jgi:hypothetical protein
MVPAQLSTFFTAAAEVSATLIGLLFVAIAIDRDQIFGAPEAPYAVATNTFIALLDAFFVSFAALLSVAVLPWISLGIGSFALLGTVALGYTLLSRELNPRLVRRRSFLVMAAFVAYLLQCWFALRLLGLLPAPAALDPAYGLASVLLGVFAVGMWRAFGLLGARRTGLREWLGPRHYTEDEAPAVSMREVDRRQ